MSRLSIIGVEAGAAYGFCTSTFTESDSVGSTGPSYESLSTAFRHGNFKPLYFLYGQETFLIDELQEILIEKALRPEERPFNFDLIYGAEADVLSVLGICSSYPVMAERRLVVVRDFDKLKQNKNFVQYAANPNPHAIVFLACSGKPNLSAHPYRALKEAGCAVEFKPFREEQMGGWIRDRVRSAGHEIEPEALRILVEYVGTDLRNAAFEIEKLITFAGGRHKLTADDVIRASGQTREYNVFELQRVVGERQYAAAVRIAERLLQQASNSRSECLMIQAILAGYFSKLWRLHLLAGAPEREMAQKTGINPYYIKEYLQALRRFSPDALQQALDALLAAEFELKGGSLRDERTTLFLLLRRLCSDAPRTAAAA